MKTQKIKLLTATVLALALVFSLSVSAFAATPRTVNGIGKTFVADSSTKATATVQATSSGATPYITSKITLQSAPSGSTSFSNASGVSPSTKTVYNRTAILHSVTFAIQSSKEYRIRIDLTDEVNGVETTTTTYCNLSR